MVNNLTDKELFQDFLDVAFENFSQKAEQRFEQELDKLFTRKIADFRGQIQEQIGKELGVFAPIANNVLDTTLNYSRNQLSGILLKQLNKAQRNF